MTIIIIPFTTLAFLISIVLIFELWIPTTQKLRVKEKTVGKLTYYRAELYRPVFGWTGFNASRYDGSIWTSDSWTNEKSYCESNIHTYKQLKNIE
jgi:hypothetical protein